MPSEKVALHAFVHGQVQGVFFRRFVQRHAQRLRLCGFTRNLPSGDTVEVYAQGEPTPLEQLLELLRQGPTDANVAKVSVEWQKPHTFLQDFRILD